MYTIQADNAIVEEEATSLSCKRRIERVSEFLSDGKWHTQHEMDEKLGFRVPPYLLKLESRGALIVNWNDGELVEGHRLPHFTYKKKKAKL